MQRAIIAVGSIAFFFPLITFAGIGLGESPLYSLQIGLGFMLGVIMTELAKALQWKRWPLIIVPCMVVGHITNIFTNGCWAEDLAQYVTE